MRSPGNDVALDEPGPAPAVRRRTPVRRRTATRRRGSPPPQTAAIALVLALQHLLTDAMDSTARTIRLALLLVILGALALGVAWMWR
ncbi:hypothetical protein [Actinomadura oligospora]|uniref:hypothetical protein n=1 Tax=Actinomadura oligospora TaxID=111804 RepID=UPI000479BF54|nr:hypothetical protein [Actinomadura oligospora]